ncbi:hypothetical protein GCM10010994_45830 [Chelatococcus reniformis]|uniref:Uncharacterized protein n=1 Tax=Chelatococcus reniformis TaxID=1494448 RepID=A0A916XMH9_9HYPH|nr:hypothetical protein GCM10010994_45830 [Chelatococcus reniformis]
MSGAAGVGHPDDEGFVVYLDGELDSGSRARIEALVAADPGCGRTPRRPGAGRPAVPGGSRAAAGRGATGALAGDAAGHSDDRTISPRMRSATERFAIGWKPLRGAFDPKSWGARWKISSNGGMP